MQVHRELIDSLPVFRNAVVTIGSFDGVHIGHRQIIQQLKQEARRIGGETVIITFHPHPRKVVSSVPGDVKLLTTLPEKIQLLEEAGIDHLVIVPFDHVFSDQTAEQYIGDFLHRYFRPHTVIIGYDHRFGKGREGDYQLMETYGSRLGFEVKEIPAEVLHELVISSTRIREALGEADIVTANEFLGYPYFFEGKVVKGNQLGRTLGYPTANLHIASEEKLVPSNGVYAVTVKTEDGHQHGGMMNIGIRPTIDGSTRVIEVNIFDFDRDIYGQELVVSLHRYIRGEVKFSGLDALKQQLSEDRIDAMRFLAGQ
ncbi:bifunctional riboflavin kinase/FAD synthetase [Sediminibacterium soli]|uniref:bifunctional riboflavin kinase/FAD synthetase n=1 Tax=Sediminibacterium soli TaxID=2698829 RepID=UPI00137A3C62|nr:bifunctional riboflavin kinase/FAD synthetase [Sediminibacterium soli]NCI47049.1 bifunctional riboflavin kinase/FAD synthetase [Sediminibacterium soli]